MFNILDVITSEELITLRFKAEGIYHFCLEQDLFDRENLQDIEISIAKGLDVSTVAIYMLKKPCSEKDPPLSGGQTHHEIPFMGVQRLGKSDLICFPVYGAKFETITENVTYVILR